MTCFCCWLGGGSCPLDRRARADKRTWGRFYQGRNVAHAARASERGATPNLACSLRVGGVSDLSWTDSRTRVCRLIRHPSAQTSFPFEERRIGHKIACHPRIMQGNLLSDRQKHAELISSYYSRLTSKTVARPRWV